MLYREAGQFKSTYAQDQQIFPILQDRVAVIALLVVAFAVVPIVGDQYWLSAIITPFLVLSLAALGLNILTGYAGQLSLGAAAFMAVGAFMAYNAVLRIPGVPILVAFAIGGLSAAAVGIVFGLPSLRIKGLYLAVATLAAQFFFDWVFLRVKWFTNYAPSGSVNAPRLEFFGLTVDNPIERYLLCLVFVTVFAVITKNLVRGNLGRQWMAIRDMDIAAELMGIRPLYAKLTAFAVSSYIVGVAGALWAFVYLGSWEPLAFDINRSLQLLFMVIIGGLGSILGSFLGAGFILMLPIFLNQVPATVGLPIHTDTVTHLEFIIFGSLICYLLIAEPRGFARLWSIGKEKLRLWPYPH